MPGPARSPPRPCNMCYISCVYSCVLTRNIKNQRWQETRGGEKSDRTLWMQITWLSVDFLNRCPLCLRSTDFLPAGSSSLETWIFPLNFNSSNHQQRFKDNRKKLRTTNVSFTYSLFLWPHVLRSLAQSWPSGKQVNSETLALKLSVLERSTGTKTNSKSIVVLATA